MSDGDEREIYRGRILTLWLRTLRRESGQVVVREIVSHAPGAAVVAIDQDGQVLLVRQERPAVAARVLELPAGLVDAGEGPRACAARELEEETGYRAGALEPLVTFYSSPGFTTERIHVFVATDLQVVDPHPDEEEEIEVVHLPLDVAIETVLQADVSDAKTVTGLLAYARCRERSL